jgi:hypothetical protein
MIYYVPEGTLILIELQKPASSLNASFPSLIPMLKSSPLADTFHHKHSRLWWFFVPGLVAGRRAYPITSQCVK